MVIRLTERGRGNQTRNQFDESTGKIAKDATPPGWQNSLGIVQQRITHGLKAGTYTLGFHGHRRRSKNEDRNYLLRTLKLPPAGHQSGGRHIC